MAKEKEVKKKKVKTGVKAELKQDTIEITEEIAKLNPFLADEGVNVGETVVLDADLKAILQMPEKKVGGTKEATKFSCPISILKGGEYIRTYPEGQEEQAKSFLSKDPNYQAIEPDEIVSISVSWRENEVKKDSETGRMVDTGRLLSQNIIFSEKNNGENWMKLARALANAGPKRSCVAKLKTQ